MADPRSNPMSSTRKDIERRLGCFARQTFDNCGIGPGGFEPGNTCGSEKGGGSTKDKPSRGGGVKGIEERARAAGKSFTEQWLEETRADIDRDYRRDAAAEQRRDTAKVRRAETALAETKARGPERTERAEEVDRAIADIDRRIAEVQRQREEDRSRAATLAEERAASKARRAELERQLAESKKRAKGLRI